MHLRLGHKSRYVAVLQVSLCMAVASFVFFTTDAEDKHIKRIWNKMLVNLLNWSNNKKS
jgi:hypothetical protein